MMMMMMQVRMAVEAARLADLESALKAAEAQFEEAGARHDRLHASLAAIAEQEHSIPLIPPSRTVQ
jgi:hypothetical protein